jgi:carboxypeptidase Taq
MSIAALSSVIMGKCQAFSTATCTPAAAAMIKYSALEEKLKEIEKLSGVKGLLGWDEMVLLSPGSATARNNQKSALSSVIYEKQTSPELKDLLVELLASDLSVLPSDYERAVVRDADRDFSLTARKTKDMTVREAELEGRGYQTWADARKESDFGKFAPVLKEIVELKREIGTVTHPHLGAYDANVDSFERGMKTVRLNEILSAAKVDLVPLIKAICSSDEKKKYVTPKALEGGEDWSIESQKALCSEIAEKIGFDFDKYG